MSANPKHPACPDKLDEFMTRVVAKRLNRGARGMLASEKMRGPALWTTPLQRDAMTLFELNQNIVSYKAWPRAVTLKVEGDSFDYFPSMGFVAANGREMLVDLIRDEDRKTPGRPWFNSMLARALADEGIGFLCLSETEVCGDRRLPNARLVMRSAGFPVSPAAEFACVKLFSGYANGLSLGELRTLVANGDQLSGTACVLSMRRVLAIDLSGSGLDTCIVNVPQRKAA